MSQVSKIISPNFHVSFEELCRSADISADHIIDLVDFNIIFPIKGKKPPEWRFSSNAVHIANKAARLHRDLQVDWEDIGLVINLLDEIEQLENENTRLKKQLNQFLIN